MKEEFEYGELVEVRNTQAGVWNERHYVGTMPNCKGHWVMHNDQNPQNFDGRPVRWEQIQKIQPEHDLIEIEQPESIEERLDKFEAILNGAIAHINAQINSIKKQLK